MSQQNDGFASEGREVFPNLYFDDMQAHEFSTWPQQPLEDLNGEYMAFLERDDLMPHHRAKAETIRSHILFELTYRGLQELKQ